MTTELEDMLVFVRRRLKEEGRSRWEGISTDTEVGIRVIERIAYGAKHSPRYVSVCRLAAHLGYPVTAESAA